MSPALLSYLLHLGCQTLLGGKITQTCKSQPSHLWFPASDALSVWLSKVACLLTSQQPSHIPTLIKLLYFILNPAHLFSTDNLAPIPQRTRSQKMVNLIISVSPSCSYTSAPILTNLPWSRRKKGPFLDFGTTASSPLCERWSLFFRFPWCLALNFTPTQDSTLSEQPPPSFQFGRPLELPCISSSLSSQLPLIPSVCSLLPDPCLSFKPWPTDICLRSTGTALAKITNEQLLDLRDSVQFFHLTELILLLWSPFLPWLH